MKLTTLIGLNRHAKTQTQSQPSPDPLPLAVRAQLDRILASALFRRAERPGRFLRFLVEQALNGQTDRLNERSLAVEIFNRKPSFDPDIDPIVRVEAGRLRQRLQAYHQGDGQNDPVLIELPPRTYIPAFRNRQLPPPPAPPQRLPGWKTVGLALAGFILLALAAYWGIATWRSRPPGSSATNPPGITAPPLSIVVLPFTDLSPDENEEYFCDGLTEELIETLTKVEGLRVVSRTSAFQFKGKTFDIRRVGAELNVRMVLEGSVRKEGNKARVTAQLVNSADGYHLWSRVYDREIRQVFGVQKEIAQDIVHRLQAELGGGRWLRPLEEYSPDSEAHNLYLQGLHDARQWTADGFLKAVEHFERAISIDPKYASAHAQLAECYALLGVHAGLRPTEVMPKAKAAAEKALELDSTLPDAHAALGLVKGVYDWDWVGAERSFRRAYGLDPSDASVREAYVMGYLVPTGRLDDALREILEARTLDPISPHVDAVVGLIYYFQRRHDLAIEYFRKTLELDPHFYAAHLALGSAYAQKSMFDKALERFQEGKPAWQSGMGASFLGHIYALMGKKADAQAQLDELLRASESRYVSPAYIAVVYLGLGDKGRAMEWLEKAYQERSATLVFLKVNPRFDSLRSDPRFISLLKRVHLE